MKENFPNHPVVKILSKIGPTDINPSEEDVEKALQDSHEFKRQQKEFNDHLDQMARDHHKEVEVLRQRTAKNEALCRKVTEPVYLALASVKKVVAKIFKHTSIFVKYVIILVKAQKEQACPYFRFQEEIPEKKDEPKH